MAALLAIRESGLLVVDNNDPGIGNGHLEDMRGKKFQGRPKY